MNDTLNFFKNINLPEMKLSNMTWPTFERESNNSINTYAIEMHPKRFGKIINEPFKHDCEAIWKSVLDY